MESNLDNAKVIERIIQKMTDSYDINELRILDAFLSRCDVQDPDATKVSFTMQELKSITGNSEMSAEVIDKLTDDMMESIHVLGEKNGEWVFITLFEKSKYYFDDILKQDVLTIYCSNVAKEYLFNTENINYIKQCIKDAQHSRV
jgi:hypothetical protein